MPVPTIAIFIGRPYEARTRSVASDPLTGAPVLIALWANKDRRAHAILRGARPGAGAALRPRCVGRRSEAANRLRGDAGRWPCWGALARSRRLRLPAAAAEPIDGAGETGGAGGVEEAPVSQQHAVRPPGDVDLVRLEVRGRQRAGDHRPRQAHRHRHRLHQVRRRRRRLEPVQQPLVARAPPRRAQASAPGSSSTATSPPPRRRVAATSVAARRRLLRDRRRGRVRGQVRRRRPLHAQRCAPPSARPSRSRSPASLTSTTTRPTPTRSSSGPAAPPFNQPQMYWKTIGTSVREVFEHTYLYNRIWGHPIYPIGQTYEAPGNAPAAALPPLRRELRRAGAELVGLAGDGRPASGARSAPRARLRPVTGYRRSRTPAAEAGQPRRHGRLGAGAPDRRRRGTAESPGSSASRRAPRVRAFQEAHGLAGRRPDRHRHLAGAARLRARAGRSWAAAPARASRRPVAPCTGEPAPLGLAPGDGLRDRPRPAALGRRPHGCRWRSL